MVIHDANTSTLTVLHDGVAANRTITEHPTSEIYSVLLQHKFLVLPTIARPSALIYVKSQECYGTLLFDKENRTCYDPDTAKYVCHYFKDDNRSTIHLTGLDLMDLVVQEREKIFVRTEAFLLLPEIVRLLPVASENTYMQAKLWYPNKESMHEDDHVCVLIRRGSSDR